MDFGAINTGVFRACYTQGASLQEITQREGEVLILDNRNYTLLLTDRTAKRHMRRGFDRRKMAMRLLVKVLEEYFNFPANKHRQALGFFLNRRGFSRVEESFDVEAFKYFPRGAWDALPESVKKGFDSPEKLHNKFNDLLADSIEEFKTLDAIISKTVLPYTQAKKAKSYIEKVSGCIEHRLQSQTIEETKTEQKKLSKIPESILDTWKNSGLDCLPDIPARWKKVNFLEWLNKAGRSDLERLHACIPVVIDSLKERSGHLFASVDTGTFEIENAQEAMHDHEHKDHNLNHLKHLRFAIHQIAEELRSGGRHRRKYFEEVTHDMASLKQHPHGYMQKLGEALEAHDQLDADKLNHIICHISNLELKPLRAYFNDKRHQRGDQWQPEKLADIVSRWFMKSWRVNTAKDGAAKVEAYTALRTAWQNHSGKSDMVQFWLDTEPELTIPPYQSHTNRRPPDCQSLVLNATYLNSRYPNWKTWLKVLMDDGDVLHLDLSDIKSSKDKALVDDSEQQCRQLQFALDRSQKSDSYKLNRIWSHYHRMQKHAINSDKYRDAKDCMEKEISESQLPNSLKDELKFEVKNSFGHFINKYYQTRRRARDGRFFIHPVTSKNRAKIGGNKHWHDETTILTLCSHRPRQKKHQLLLDFAAIVGLKPDNLVGQINKSGFDSITDFLENIKGLKINAEKAAKAQKDYRGRLKLETNKEKLQMSLLDARKRKAAIKKYPLAQLDERVQKLACQLAAKLWPDISESEQQQKAKRFQSIHSVSQIHNLVFKERSGFSNTCPACSMDNAMRTQMDAADCAFACRLPALSIRLIDGAVMRLVEHKSHEIAKRHWRMIEPRLKSGRDVSVPLILEENRFEFEPDLAALKGRKSKNKNHDPYSVFTKKEERVQKDAKGICAYNGQNLSDTGEIDHVIPRASIYGTLNDEANLIYVSRTGNGDKGKRSYSLSNLNNGYKKAQFDTSVDDEIRTWIYQTLLHCEPDITELPGRFYFGDYMSFITLDDDQQKAMRHALFLNEADPLRVMVIRSLQNRNRTFVNGTQRYFAQKIADKLYDRARKSGYQKRLSFDYFEFPADPQHPLSTQGLRHDLQLLDQVKAKGDKQESYSHFVDAQMAFLLAAEDHKNDGSMGISFAEDETVWPINKVTGEIQDQAYQAIMMKPKEVADSVRLERKASPDGVRTHRAFHRDNFYADRYFPVLVSIMDEALETRAGFSWGNAAQISGKQLQSLFQLVRLFAMEPGIRSLAESAEGWNEFCSRLLSLKETSLVCIPWNRQLIHEHCMENYSAKSLSQGLQYTKEIGMLLALAYQTQKKKIDEPKVIFDVLENEAKFLQKKYNHTTISLPFSREWEALKKAWIDHGEAEKGEQFQGFLVEYFLGSGQHMAAHHKIRKAFSLPVLNENAQYLQKRNTVSNGSVYQLIADSDSRKDGNKFKRLVLTKQGDLVEVINSPFVSKRMFYLKNKNEIHSGDDIVNIDPNRWYKMEQTDWPEGVKEISYKIDNVTRPKVQVILIEKDDIKSDEIFQHPLLKAKDKATRASIQKQVEEGKMLEYTTSGFSREIKSALLASLQRKS